MSPVQAPTLMRQTVVSPRRQRSLLPLALAAAAVMLLVGWWFLWRPQWRELRALPQVDSFAAVRQTVAVELASLQRLTSEYSQLTATDHKRLALALPQGQDIPNLLAQFEGMAEETNFSINDISFAAIKAPTSELMAAGAALGDMVGTTTAPVEDKAQELRINVIIEGGDYADLKKFIAATEQSIRLMQLMSVNFTTKSGNRGGVVYTLNFRTVYLSP